MKEMSARRMPQVREGEGVHVRSTALLRQVDADGPEGRVFVLNRNALHVAGVRGRARAYAKTAVC